MAESKFRNETPQNSMSLLIALILFYRHNSASWLIPFAFRILSKVGKFVTDYQPYRYINVSFLWFLVNECLTTHSSLKIKLNDLIRIPFFPFWAALIFSRHQRKISYILIKILKSTSNCFPSFSTLPFSHSNLTLIFNSKWLMALVGLDIYKYRTRIVN